MKDASPMEVLGQASPAAAAAFGQLRLAATEGGLDATTEELVVVASLAARGQLASLAVHVRRALRDGVSADLLRHAIVATLAASALFGEVVAALSTIDEVVSSTAAAGSVASHAPADDSGRDHLRLATPVHTIDGPLSASLFAPEHPSAVVLLHSLALDRSTWSPLVDPLATQLAVLACDLPGHGLSPGSPEPSVEAMADEVAATMDAAGLGAAAVVGMSLGGSVAQALAVRHPEKVRALALLDTTAYYGPEAPASWAQRADQARRQGLDSLSQFQLERWFSDDFRQRRPDLCNSVLQVFAGTDLDGYADACTALGAMDLRQGIESIPCPTTVVVGEHDEATPPAHAEQLHKSIKGSNLHVLAGCKHLSAVERPVAVLALIADLLGA